MNASLRFCTQVFRRSTDAGSSFAEILTDSSLFYLIDSGLTPATEYVYQVKTSYNSHLSVESISETACTCKYFACSIIYFRIPKKQTRILPPPPLPHEPHEISAPHYGISAIMGEAISSMTTKRGGGGGLMGKTHRLL